MYNDIYRQNSLPKVASVRFNEEEAKLVLAAAKKSGKTVCGWLRIVAVKAASL